MNVVWNYYCSNITILIVFSLQFIMKTVFTALLIYKKDTT